MQQRGVGRADRPHGGAKVPLARRYVTAAFHNRHAAAAQVSFGRFIESNPIRGVPPSGGLLSIRGQAPPSRAVGVPEATRGGARPPPAPASAGPFSAADACAVCSTPATGRPDRRAACRESLIVDADTSYTYRDVPGAADKQVARDARQAIPAKAKPTERRGRKASGLTSACQAGHDSGVAASRSGQARPGEGMRPARASAAHGCSSAPPSRHQRTGSRRRWDPTTISIHARPPR